MAKGDDSRARNQIKYQGDQAQNRLNNLWDTITPQNQTFWNNYLNAMDQAKQDYGNIQGQYQEFAKTGGYSPMDLQNIRARAVAPTRAVYAGAMRDVDRARALGGGYAPNYIAARSRINRDLSSSLSDSATNTEGMIAQLRNQGRQFGISGQAGLYGTTPGMANMAAGNLLNSTNQLAGLGSLQNQLANSIMGNTIQAGQLPGKSDYAFDRIKQIAQIASGVASGFGGGGTGQSGWSSPFGGSNQPWI